MSTIYLKAVSKFNERNLLPLKYVRIFSLTICFVSLFSVAAIDYVFAGSEDVTLTNVTRISHPAYQMGSMWYSIRNPWNQDFKRVMMYEKTQTFNGISGRGLVWGYVNQLKSWKTKEEYDNVAKPLPKANSKEWKATSVYWSPFSGEENIVYGVVKNDNRLMKVNVDTRAWEAIISFDPGDGTDISNAISIGWTLDNNFTVNFNGEWSGGYEIDVHAKTRRHYSNWPARCSEDGRRFPFNSHGHSDKSPDGTKAALEYGQTHGNSVKNLVTCKSTEDLAYENRLPEPYPHYTTYSSWKASENWFLVCSDQFREGDPNPMSSNWLSAPEIMTFAVWQVYFDQTGNFEYREILRVKSSARWDKDSDHKNGNETWNSHANLDPVLRKDGRQIYFLITDGKYSYDDYQAKGVTPWGLIGVFLADLSAADTTPPAPPKGLSIF